MTTQGGAPAVTTPGADVEQAGEPGTPGRAPKVTLGLPVYNAERYLPTLVPEYLSQTFTDFELVISDNASTDATEQLAREFAAQDPRVRHVRQKTNIGMSPNFQSLRGVARGEYFRWGAADDLIGPGYVAACVAALDANPDAVIAQGRCVDVDVDGNVLVEYPPLDVTGPDPARRLRAVLGPHESHEYFGVMRMDALRTVARAVPSHPECDRVILTAMALRGPFVYTDDAVFQRRWHTGQTMQVRRTSERVRIHDPRRSGFTLPAFELGYDLLREIHRAPLTRRQRLACYAAMRVWLRHNYVKMIKNVGRAAIEVVGAAGRRLRPGGGRTTAAKGA